MNGWMKIWEQWFFKEAKENVNWLDEEKKWILMRDGMLFYHLFHHI
jgi:hypothetical protein